MSHLIPCPECDKILQVPEEFLGTQVQCPECKHTFVAAIPEMPRATAKVQVTRETDRRSSQRDEDNFDEDDLDPRPRPGRFRCPYCASREVPTTRSQISAAGWAVFVVMILFCFPLFWIGLLITEDYRVCSECGCKIGG